MAELFIGIEGVSMRYSGAVMADEKGRVLSSYWRPDPLSLHTTNSDDLREGLIRLLYGLARNASLRYGDLDGSRICIGPLLCKLAPAACRAYCIH